MNDATFWVGPSEDPDRYRLTHLLGSGGEGEVWRAVRPGRDGDEVAIKIDSVPEDSDPVAWRDRMRALAALDVRGLVTVRDAFTGPVRHRIDDRFDPVASHRYVVMDHVPGLTLRAWLDEHPEASARERVRLLREVARTLSALHRGTGGRGPVTHGDVKPSNVVIGRNGRPVVVDLGLLRAPGTAPASGHSAAYSSPELRRPDGAPSPRADTFSFAVTAMETMTSLTPPLTGAGSLDLDATRRRIASIRALRVRPLLRHQLLRSLTPEPERRPPTPMRVFAGRTVAAVTVPLILVLGLSGSAYALRDSGTPAQADVAPPVTPTPTVSDGTLGVGGPGSTPAPTKRATPTASGSPTATTTVAPEELDDAGRLVSGSLDGGTVGDVPYQCAPRAGRVYGRPAGSGWSWGADSYSLTLVSRKQIRILAVDRVRRQAAQPNALEQTLSVTCPGTPVLPPLVCRGQVTQNPPYRTDADYLADIGHDRLRETTRNRSKPLGILGRKCDPPTVISLATENCQGNYDYAIKLRYQVDGDPTKVYTQVFAPIHSRARVRAVPFRVALEGVTTDVHRRFSGVPRGCDGTAVPYTSVGHEIAELFVKAVAERRRAQKMNRADAIAQIAEEIAEAGSDEIGYDRARLAMFCSQADAHPADWRSRCGAPDPPS